MIEDSGQYHVDQSDALMVQTPQSTISNKVLSHSHFPEHNLGSGKVKIYPVIEGIQSKKTQISYQRCFNRFLNHIKIHDLQVLLDFSQKVIKQMLVDYILYLRDERKLSRPSIIIHLSAILHFFQINNDEFTLTIRNLKIHLP